MKTLSALLVVLVASACRGPDVPSAFQPDSPASPAASPAPRGPVAAVLEAAHPLDATACAPARLCLSPASGGTPAPAMDHAGHGGHHHHP